MNIYIGNISFNATENDVRNLFSQFGEVTAVNLIRDKETGKLRGFGFVEMADDAQAQAAIAQLNGTELKGRTITVNEARPKKEGGRDGGGRGGRSNSGGGGRGRNW